MQNDSKPILIDLGCGKDKYQNPEYRVFGIDLWSKSDADVKASCLLLPIRDQSIDRIFARHFFEHFTYEQLKVILGECYRVLRKNGELEIIVPHYSCISAYQDPTHRLFFTKRTFYKFGPMGFKPKEFQFYWFREPYTGRFPFIIKLMNKLINRMSTLERFYSLIGGVYEMRCVLEKNPSMLDSEHTDGAKILA
jgi:ubiquinone/menaquinone biosynthesis C-methylase UbiE